MQKVIVASSAVFVSAIAEVQGQGEHALWTKNAFDDSDHISTSPDISDGQERISKSDEMSAIEEMRAKRKLKRRSKRRSKNFARKLKSHREDSSSDGNQGGTAAPKQKGSSKNQKDSSDGGDRRLSDDDSGTDGGDAEGTKRKSSSKKSRRRRKSVLHQDSESDGDDRRLSDDDGNNAAKAHGNSGGSDGGDRRLSDSDSDGDWMVNGYPGYGRDSDGPQDWKSNPSSSDSDWPQTPHQPSNDRQEAEWKVLCEAFGAANGQVIETETESYKRISPQSFKFSEAYDECKENAQPKESDSSDLVKRDFPFRQFEISVPQSDERLQTLINSTKQKLEQEIEKKRRRYSNFLGDDEIRMECNLSLELDPKDSRRDCYAIPSPQNATVLI